MSPEAQTMKAPNMFRLKIHRGALGCGTSIATIVTALVMSGLLPPELSTPEFASAASGFLSALASAVGICGIVRKNPAISDEQGGEM